MVVVGCNGSGCNGQSYPVACRLPALPPILNHDHVHVIQLRDVMQDSKKILFRRMIICGAKFAFSGPRRLRVESACYTHTVGLTIMARVFAVCEGSTPRSHDKRLYTWDRTRNSGAVCYVDKGPRSPVPQHAFRLGGNPVPQISIFRCRFSLSTPRLESTLKYRAAARKRAGSLGALTFPLSRRRWTWH